MAANIILINSEEDKLPAYFCKVNKERMKITAIIAHIGPRINDKDTAGKVEKSPLVFWNKIPLGKK